VPVSSQSLTEPPEAPTHDEVKNAHLILVHAHEATHALLDAFDASRGARRATGGNTTDEEQDLLRAMLVFAGAGLDASVKRLIQETLPALARQNEAARQSLESFVARRLRDEASRAADTAKGYSLLASALVNDSPRAALVSAYVEELIGSSLQSVDRVFEALSALGLRSDISVDRATLKRVFDDRNAIVHEMDMDLSLPNRRRTSRRRDPMIAGTNALLSLGSEVLAAVDSGLG